MAQIEIDGATYRLVRPINALVQFDLAAKLSPLLAGGLGEFVALWIKLNTQGIRSIGDLPAGRLGEIITPVAREMARMTNEDRRYVVNICLATLDRRADGQQGWAPIWDPDSGRAMFKDVENDLSLLVRLLLFVLQESLGNFSLARLFVRSGGAAG